MKTQFDRYGFEKISWGKLIVWLGMCGFTLSCWALLIAVAFTSCGCTNLRELRDRADEIEDQVDELRGKDKADEVSWQSGRLEINVAGLETAEWRCKFTAPDLTRPPGHAERMVLEMDLGEFSYKFYIRVGRNYAVRHRVKPGDHPTYHVTGTVCAVPTDEWEARWKLEAGALWLWVNGELCDEYPIPVPGARLRRITLDHESGGPRPMGMRYEAGEVKKGGE